MEYSIISADKKIGQIQVAYKTPRNPTSRPNMGYYS